MKWVSVLDRMPPEDVDILFIELLLSPHMHLGYFYSGKWFSYLYDSVSEKKVTHWTPVENVPDIDSLWKIRQELY